MTPQFSENDREQLEQSGISIEEAERQYRLLTQPVRYVRLVRPCTVGDGIERLTDARLRELHELHGEAAASGRLTKFVPASGAASRIYARMTGT